MPDYPPLGWHSRGYLPHLDAFGEIQFLTFRLADSLPASVIERWKRDLASLPESTAEAALRERIADFEDAGHGSCLLGDPAHAKTVEEALRHFDGNRYRLHEWVIMPNHVHVLVEPQTERLDRIVKSWKAFTAHMINKASGRSGAFWGREYYDRYIRDENHYLDVRSYIRENPVQARLCAKAEDWEFGSASWERRFGER